MSNIEIIAQVDRVHDLVHVAYDSELMSARERFDRIKKALIDTDRLLELLNREIWMPKVKP